VWSWLRDTRPRGFWIIGQSGEKGGRGDAWGWGARDGEFEEMSVAVLLLDGIKERFCAGVVEGQSLGTRITTICAYIGSESDEVPHWIMSVQRRYAGSTHGGKSIRLECKSCRA